MTTSADTSRQQLQALAERIAKASGPDRELDGMVWCAADGYEFVQWDGAGVVYRGDSRRGITHQPADHIREYSASIDSALALVERLKPGVFWLIGKGKTRSAEPPFGAQLLFGTKEILGEGEAATAPLAILRALIAALLSEPARD